MVRFLFNCTSYFNWSNVLSLNRCSSTSNFVQVKHLTSWRLTHLPHRQLVQVNGKDAENLLQGLVTNDIRHLDESRCIFAFFLNHLGRVICDTFIYKIDKNNLLLEIDTSLVSTVTNHLIKHKLRKDVSIRQSLQGQTWVLFPSVDNIEVTTSVTELKEWSDRNNFVISNDNRTPFAMARIAIRETDVHFNILSHVANHIGGQDNVSLVNALQYEEYRYAQGLSEGPSDHLKDVSFPLECNGDYMQGISFFKGCYIGQELTARTYHTGVIRKRLMPLILHDNSASKWLIGKDIKSTDVTITRKVGKIRSVCLEKNLALGLMYISLVESVPSVLNDLGDLATVKVPTWWPKEKKSR